MKKAIALFVLGIFLAGSAFGAVAVDEDSVYVGEAVTLDFQKLPQGADAISKSGSDIVIDFNYGANEVVVESDTPDTLTTAEGGTTFVLTNDYDGGRTIGLPAVTSANDGLWFVIQKGAPNADRAITDDIAVLVQPQDGDRLTYTSKIDAGSGLKASVAQSDSYPTVKVVVVDGDWYVESAKGTWASN
jgi:hypothetical protein